MAYRRRRRRRAYGPIKRVRRAVTGTRNLGHGPVSRFKAAWRQLMR